MKVPPLVRRLARLRHWPAPMVRAGAQPLRSLRAVRNRDLQRALPSYHRRTARVLLADAVLLAVALATHWVFFLAIVAVFVAAALALAWRARPTWGEQRNWPPGSVAVDHDSIADPQHLMRATRRYGRMFKSNFFAEPMICIADLGLAAALFRDHEDELAQIPLSFDRFVPGGMIRYAEGSVHTDRRAAFSRALSPRLVRSSEPTMARIVRSALERMARECEGSGRAVGPRDRFREMVLATWSRVLFGIDADASEYQEVRSIFTDLDIYQPRARTDEAVLARLDRLQQLIRAAVERGGAVDEASSMAEEYARASPDALADPGTIRNLILTAVTTREDVGGLLTWVFKHLCDNPAWVDRARDDLQLGGDLVDRIVCESLRLEQSEYVMRRAKNDIRFNGFVIPADWMIRICVHEAHRDPTKFENPDRFDPDRFLGDRYSREVYSPLGIGKRSCVGDVLTRTMAWVFVTELVRNFEWDVVSDGPREFSSHRHWAPSSQLAVILRRRSPLPADG